MCTSIGDLSYDRKSKNFDSKAKLSVFLQRIAQNWFYNVQFFYLFGSKANIFINYKYSGSLTKHVKKKILPMV